MFTATLCDLLLNSADRILQREFTTAQLATVEGQRQVKSQLMAEMVLELERRKRNTPGIVPVPVPLEDRAKWFEAMVWPRVLRMIQTKWLGALVSPAVERMREVAPANRSSNSPESGNDEQTNQKDWEAIVEAVADDNVDESVPWPQYMSAKDLAERLNLPKEGTRKKLKRMADKQDCFIANESPRKGEAKRLYRVQDVLPQLRQP